ncbi:MAG: Lrp/AsnC family transcriptional regulator [Gammaproteobacteria bacterium]|nr:Lrp/AsnC family transcriptional regulator [Gammaproteobacteria bacterium]MCZ6853484.1 Lrp/AsnC family transcriptional regulator [Gammaproteobacteria bacterium]
MKIDQTDERILESLQTHGRLANQQLAENLGLSPASCWRRIRALEESGVIQRYAALLNRKLIGLNLCTFVHVSLARHDKQNVSAFEAAIKNHPEVLECYATTGDADFMLRVVTHDIEAYDRFLENFIFTLPGLLQVKSNIALREIKFETKLPVTDRTT